jgi:tetratricopeptide (TPR) repeat protein
LEVDDARGEVMLRACLRCPDVTSSAYRMLADTLLGRGAADEARRVLLRGRRRFPSSAPLLLALGRVERDTGRADAALATLAEAHRLRPDDEFIEGEYQRLLARYGTPEQKAEARVRPLIREASGRFELEDADGALATLAVALQRAGSHPRVRGEVRYRMALVELGRGRSRAALRHVKDALDGGEAIPPRLRTSLLLVQSEAYLSLTAYPAAAQASREAAAISDENPLAHANLALAELQLGHRAAAREALSRAIERGLSRLLTFDQLVELGPQLLDDPSFDPLLDSGWPGARATRASATGGALQPR